MPPADEHRETHAGASSPFHRSDDSSSRRAGATVPRSDGQASGELEGSTLGSSSRDGERRTLGQRRTQSSSGFLVDSYSLPRVKSSRLGLHRSRPSEPNTEKRSAPEGDIVVPKRRSRFPWHRHRDTTSEPVSDDPSSSAANTQQQQTPTPPPDTAAPSRASPGPELGTDHKETLGLDRDSIQIVNLALNLNESRKRTAPGFPIGAAGRRPISVSQPAAGPVDPHASFPRGESAQHFRNYSQVQSDHLSLPTQQVAQSPVLDLLPASAVDTNRALEFSESTIARAERARRHFDLRHEYLRLLPLLPPLRSPQIEDGPDSSQAMASVIHRVYNPLQVIRNRRIRYREKSSIDLEGWSDVGKVHDWVNFVEDKYKHKTHGQSESIRLPPFLHGRSSQSRGDAEDDDMDVASPPSSLRRVSRTNSVKAPRPRMDWKFSPAELLADAAWLEDGANKAKIVDKNGNKLYPDAKELVMMDSGAEVPGQHKRQLSVEKDPAEGELSSRTSLSSSRPAMTHDFKSVGRGRHRNRLHGHSQDLGTRSASSSQKPSPWDKMRMRTGSVSSDSSAEKRPSVDQKRRTWGHSRQVPRTSAKDAANLSEARALRAKSPAGVTLNNQDQPQTAQLPSISTKSGHIHRKASMSSAGSVGNPSNPRMSLEGMDSTAPSSPAHAGYFPSIAVNLSPPSSRSPSPAKKGLRHKITSRHERSKSKQGDGELKEIDDEAMNVENASRQAAISPPERDERVSKLEPSPLPDVVSSSYADEHGIIEGQRTDRTRGRKSQHLPESKLRGIFKGPGRIAEFVGNEVSKVGDMILKKDTPPDTRRTTSTTDLTEEDTDGGLLRRETDKGPSSRSFMPSLPTFTSPLRQDDRTSSPDAAEWGSPRERASATKRHDDRNAAKRMMLNRSKTLDFHPTHHHGRDRVKHAIKDPFVPFSLTRPPVTGLAQARASPGPPAENQPPLSGARTWSISDRSIQTLKDSGIPGKTEIERTRALLLSSGVKAREITRRANSVRNPQPHWLQSALGPNASKSRVARINEFDVAAQSLLRRFETTQYSFQQSMHRFTTTSSTPLRSELKELENLINQSLTPRVRATADDAEDLCVHLNTTSTLAVKSLSDALDKGVRKRRRRLRWVRRTGFVVLEWALVGMLWWVWLIVMAFKLVRGIFRGAFSGARWILWL